MGKIKNLVTRGIALATASCRPRRGRTIVAAALALTFAVQETARATCTLADYPASLPFQVAAGNWAGRGTFTASHGALFIADNSTVENGVRTGGGHWWVSDEGFGLCRMDLDATGHWVVPPGRAVNLCAAVGDVLGQPDYDAARGYIYVPGRKTSVWRVQLAEAADGSGKEIVRVAEVRPSSQPLPEGSGLDALALNDDGSQFYVVSRNNANIWACINPADLTLLTTRCKQVGKGADNRKMSSISYNHTTHAIWMAETINLTTVDNADGCFALNSPCQAHITGITFSAFLLHPTSVLNYGRFLYIGDDTGKITQVNLDLNFLADPNAGRIDTYAFGMGGVVTGMGANPADGLQVFADPLLPNTHLFAEVTRMPLCPATP
jgi:hypothetical protein